MNAIKTIAFDKIQAAALIAAGLDVAKVRLGKADESVSARTVASELTPADFVGYTPKAITWNGVSVADDGTVEVVGSVPEFRPSDGVTPNDIYTAWVTNDTATVPLIVCRLDDGPYPMHGPDDAIVLAVRYRPSSGCLLISVT